MIFFRKTAFSCRLERLDCVQSTRKCHRRIQRPQIDLELTGIVIEMLRNDDFQAPIKNILPQILKFQLQKSKYEIRILG